MGSACTCEQLNRLRRSQPSRRNSFSLRARIRCRNQGESVLSAGVEEIWQVYPEQLMIRVRRFGYVGDVGGIEVLTSRVLVDFEIQAHSLFV